MCDVPMLWLLDETAENMVAAKCPLQYVDNNGCEGYLMAILPLLLIFVNYFLWKLKSLTRYGLSFLLKGNVKFFDLIPWALVQNIDTTLKVSCLLATSYKILVANTQFSVALATSELQFQTLPSVTCSAIPSAYYMYYQT